MLSEDAQIWTKYLKNPMVPIKEVWYDVHVGKAVEVAGAPHELMLRIAAGITRKRIDVIARVGGGFWVIEVKPFGSYLAFGQVLVYMRLFIEEYGPQRDVWPVIICEEADPDLLNDFDAAGVACIEV